MQDAAAPSKDTCPRCGGHFHCGAMDSHCPCFELKLTPQLRESIARDFDGCLCVGCLRELAQSHVTTRAPSARSAPSAP